MEEIVREIYNGVVRGKHLIVQQKIKEGLDAGVSVEAMLNEGLIASMGEVGRLFEIGKYFVPEMLQAARAMKNGMALLKPYLQQTDIKPAGTVLIGTVKGDLHDIGKDLVSVMLEGAGFQIQDLGTDVSVDRFVEAVRTNKPDILAMSALLTTTMTNFKPVIDGLEQAGVRIQVRVLVGGAPVTESYAQQVGADGYARDASRAVGVAKSLMDKQ